MENDFSRDIEKIATFSKMMGNDSDIDPVQLNKMMKFMDTLKKTMNKKEAEELTKIKPDDFLRKNKQMQIINAAIPFIDVQLRKYILIFLKFMEINSLVTGTQISMKATEDKYSTEEKRRAMLRQILPILNESERGELEKALRTMKFGEVLKTMGNGENIGDN